MSVLERAERLGVASTPLSGYGPEFEEAYLMEREGLLMFDGTGLDRELVLTIDGLVELERARRDENYFPGDPRPLGAA